MCGASMERENEERQEAQGACVAHLVLSTTSLGFAGFFSSFFNCQYKMFHSKYQCIQASDSSEEDF